MPLPSLGFLSVPRVYVFVLPSEFRSAIFSIALLNCFMWLSWLDGLHYYISLPHACPVDQKQTFIHAYYFFFWLYRLILTMHQIEWWFCCVQQRPAQDLQHGRVSATEVVQAVQEMLSAAGINMDVEKQSLLQMTLTLQEQLKESQAALLLEQVGILRLIIKQLQISLPPTPSVPSFFLAWRYSITIWSMKHYSSTVKCFRVVTHLLFCYQRL